LAAPGEESGFAVIDPPNEADGSAKEIAVSIWLIDALCALLIVIGAALAFRRPASPHGRPGLQVHASDQPQTYIMRIGGVMLATFGLALGLMATVFHFT
jgi:hypothetical protein